MMLLNTDPYSSISPSAYDTAWLAMVPVAAGSTEPMFKNCLDWVLNNQKEEGFWGDYDGHGMPTIECLPATIACLVALRKWNAGDMLLSKGLSFIQEDADDILGELGNSCPRWFAIVFPAMLELASVNGLAIVFPDRLKGVIVDIYYKRRQILEQEGLVDKCHYPPLISYLEALPSNYVDEEETVKHLCSDGSIFQSPSATASAFMATGNRDCLRYLQSLAQACANGVPQTFPMDEELVKLCMVNQVQKLGLGEHFNQEIEGVMEQVYRSYEKQESWAKQTNSIESQLYKDSLSFWLLRMRGYSVSPWRFCWFLEDGEIEEHVKNNPEHFSSVMLNVYSASQLAFPGEPNLRVASSFSRKLLEKAVSLGTTPQQNTAPPFPNFHNLIKHELRFPWIARLDHLEHRKWIEEKNITALWMGKTSYHRLSSHQNDKLKQLAVQNYEFRQSVYRSEFEDLTRWSRRWGLRHMGFGREKTAYCYFAIAASTLLPKDSEVRKIGTKCGILSTVADDFYDVQGSLEELEKLTKAVKMWDGKGLNGHSRTIFDVLDNFVSEIGAKYLQKYGTQDITNNLRSIWYETFSAWLKEAKWSRNGVVPSAEEYLEVGMTSAAIHSTVLTAACFLNPSLPNHKLRPPQYETITILCMLIFRLLNDIQSYEKEQKEGKTCNLVLLHMKENPEAEIEDSIANIRKILEKKEEELLEHALMGGFDDFSKSCRHLHLSCAKAFHMFYNSSNRFDSDTVLVKDIQNAIFIPLQIGSGQAKKLPELTKKQFGETNPTPLPFTPTTKGYETLANYHQLSQSQRKKTFIVRPTSSSSLSMPVISRNGLNVVPKFNFCFM